MAELSRAIEETAQRADRHLTRRRVAELLRLPDTESLQMTLENWTPDRSRSTAWNETKRGHLERNVRDGEERDRIISSRPEGCWCHGTGEPRKQQFGASEWCTCSDSQEVKAESDAQKAKDREHRIDIAWHQAEIPTRFFGFSLDSSPALTPVLRKRLTAEESPEDDALSRSWFLHGSYGVGKTGLAVGYARWLLEYCDGHANILFRSLPKLLNELRGTYNRKQSEESEQKVLERYQNACLLVLDDLGSEQMTDSGWLQDRLYQIIGERHDEEKATVFTSNLSIEQLAPRLGERLTWRIIEMCGKDRIIEVKGKNLRA